MAMKKYLDTCIEIRKKIYKIKNLFIHALKHQHEVSIVPLALSEHVLTEVEA